MVDGSTGVADATGTQPSDTGPEGLPPAPTATQPSDTGAGNPPDDRGSSPPWERWDEQVERIRVLESEAEERGARLQEAQPYLDSREDYEHGLSTLRNLSQNPELAQRVMKVSREYHEGRKDMVSEADPLTREVLGRVDKIDERLRQQETQRQAEDFTSQVEDHFGRLIEDRKVPETLVPVLEQLVDHQLTTQFGDREFGMREVDRAFDDAYVQVSKLTTPTSGGSPEVPPNPSAGAETTVVPTKVEQPTDKASLLRVTTEMIKNGTLFGRNPA